MIKGLSLQPKLTLVDVLFWGFLALVACGVSFYMGYDNAKREQLSELRMSGLCEASGWTPELKEYCGGVKS
jgi:hypothetical protein